ncbi:MAG: hypothetical protein HZB26_11680 [Candidatus Hydrogenedentes bacterium]|nr:hypothetical protein [Candidatus Hydrogenedentota bacterium]
MKEVLVRRMPGYIDTESFFLVDIDDDRKYVPLSKQCITDEERERSDIRFRFGEWPHDPESNMFFYAWDVEILCLESITEYVPGPILSQPKYVEMLRRHERVEEAG